ncbi:MAG: WD40/YVTN/BNR-like repeat-containing protein [Panacagrimonas sp.]
MRWALCAAVFPEVFQQVYSMTHSIRRKLWILALGACCAVGGLATAQDDEATDDAASESAEEAVVAVKPRSAEIAPLASRTLLLGIANSGKHLIAVGDRGNIVASNDGANWAQVEVPVRATLTAVEFVDESLGWAVGHDASILHSKDGGRTWQLQNFAPELEKPFLDVLFMDASRGMAIGAYGLFMTTEDGGATWTELDAPPIREEELHFNALTRLGNGDFFLVGETGMMGVSSDGQTWERLTAPYEGSLYGALPRGDSGAVIFGLRGNVYTTDNVRSGQWTQIDTGTVASFFGGTALPSGDVALVGLAGEVAILSPSGQVKNTKIDAVAGVTGAGTLSGAIPWKNGVLAVGELGVSTVEL